ncbi:hypothetical protein [Roseivivax sp. CAU 1761]
MRKLIAAALLASAAAAPALADSVSGTVHHYDAARKSLVLTDRTVWSLETLKTAPEGLTPGARVTIDFVSNADNGWLRLSKVGVSG